MYWKHKDGKDQLEFQACLRLTEMFQLKITCMTVSLRESLISKKCTYINTMQRLNSSCRNKASKLSHCSLKVKVFYPCDPMAHVVSYIKMKRRKTGRQQSREKARPKRLWLTKGKTSKFNEIGLEICGVIVEPNSHFLGSCASKYIFFCLQTHRKSFPVR